jgi:4-amino-4-deoxy-L-arabinose transferase-like glycosyltransferase
MPRTWNLKRRLIRINSGRLIVLLCMVALLITSAVAFFAFERLPHLEDEVAYLFQAKTMALGRLTVPSPNHPEAFWTPFVLDYHGQRFGKYPPGWPAVLALGELFNASWLVNPVLAVLALYLVYLLGKTLYDGRTGLLAAALGLASPLYLVLSGSFLSHMASLVWLLLFSLWFVWTAQGRSRWFAVEAGLALGMAFLTRALTAVAYAALFVVYSLVQVLWHRQSHWPRYLLIALSGGAVAALLPAYQWAVTGDPWLNPYLLWWPYDRLGFGPGIGAMPGGHSAFYAWINLKQDLSRAATDVLGWPALSWVPLALGLALRPRRLQEWVLAAPLGCLVDRITRQAVGSALLF